MVSSLDFRRAVLATPDGADLGYRVRPGRAPWVLTHGLRCDASMRDRVIARLPGDVSIYRGNVTVNVAPSPNSDVTTTLPP